MYPLGSGLSPSIGTQNTSWTLIIELESVCIAPAMEEMSDSIMFSYFMCGYLRMVDCFFCTVKEVFLELK